MGRCIHGEETAKIHRESIKAEIAMMEQNTGDHEGLMLMSDAQREAWTRFSQHPMAMNPENTLIFWPSAP